MSQTNLMASGPNNQSKKNIASKKDLQTPRTENEPVNLEPKEETKPSEPKITDRVEKKLTELSQKQAEKKPNNVKTSSSRVAEMMNKSQSRDSSSYRLPNIGDISRNFGDRIYDKQSSATLQKSILVYSMPKGQRFNSGPKYSGEPSYYVDTCFKPNSPKGVGFGFGNKRQFPEWMEKNMKENPPPGAYFDQAKHLTARPKGPTFGISYKFYEKVTIPYQKSPQRVAKSSQRLKPIFRDR